MGRTPDAVPSNDPIPWCIVSIACKLLVLSAFSSSKLNPPPGAAAMLQVGTTKDCRTLVGCWFVLAACRALTFDACGSGTDQPVAYRTCASLAPHS